MNFLKKNKKKAEDIDSEKKTEVNSHFQWSFLRRWLGQHCSTWTSKETGPEMITTRENTHTHTLMHRDIHIHTEKYK